MTLTPGTTLGSYQIVEKIGAGGMGSVYKAYQPALGRYVAIKILPPQSSGDPSFAERFVVEARAIGKLRHPNIVTAYDFAQQGDLAYLVSDFIDGGTLADQLGAPLPLEYVLTLLAPIASALDYAHARGVVHRDIKPQNILLSHEGNPVLTDFGLARIVGPGSGVTQAGALMGTADYIAPECASGVETAGPAADQYALAIVAYQMLVGTHPFPSENPISALMAHVHKPVPVPSAVGVPLPPHVESALLRGLAKKPQERFPRVGEFVRGLGSTAPQLGSSPKIAVPVPTPVSTPPVTSDAVSVPPAPVAPISEPPQPATPVSAPPARKTLPPAQPELSVMADVPLPASVARPPKRTPFWRSKKMLVLIGGVIAAFLVLSALSNRDRQGGALTDDQGNTPTSATIVSAGTHPGTIAPAGDVDWFRVNVGAGTNIVAELHLGTLSSGSISILSPTGQVLADDSDVAGRVARVSYQSRDGGSFLIRVKPARPDATGTYTMVLTTR